jgi:hypothetical protein
MLFAALHESEALRILVLPYPTLSDFVLRTK